MVQARDSRPRQGCPLPGTACCHHTHSMHYPPHWVPSPLSRKSEAATAVGTVSETGTEPEGLGGQHSGEAVRFVHCDISSAGHVVSHFNLVS